MWGNRGRSFVASCIFLSASRLKKEYAARGTFQQTLYDEAKSKGWIVISMKSDWKRIFAFEK